MNIQVCRDTSDAVALYLPQRLYLKSYAKLNISVQLPLHKVHGKALSNWELMEKLRKMILPDSFSTLKVSKHNTEVIRYDAELEDRGKLERVILRLEDRVVQLNDYPDPLKVRVCEAKSDFPSRHAWDSFFRDATDMDEMKPGERPDTIHISNLPIRWFVHDSNCDEDAPPSENIFKKAFEKFGSIRQVDVPASDPFRMQMKSAIRGITTQPSDAALYFEGYVQFGEYVGFVRCMDALRGCKLMRKKNDVAEWCGIQVEFDKTKHMTDAAVKRRAIVRERLMTRQKSKEEEERLEKERSNKREARERQKYEHSEREKLEKMREREEKRKKKQLAKLMKREDVDVNSKVAEERKKLLKAQKKLQAFRLIEELFKRIELRPELQRGSERGTRYRVSGERAARARLVERYKKQQELALDEQRKRYDSALNGRIVIRSALEVKKPKRDSSISSVSSDDRRDSKDHKRIKSEKLTTPEREMEYKKATGMYNMHAAYGFGYPFAACPPPGYPYPHQTSMYYPVRGAYYPPPAEGYSARRPYRARARGPGGGGRGRPRMPYFDGPDASQQYYKYFKKLTESENRNEHDERGRSRSRSHSRAHRRSYSRSRSRTRSRSRSRSRSHSRRRSYSRSRSRTRRSRSRSSRNRKRSRSRTRRSRSHHTRSRSRSRKRSRSHSRRSKSKTEDKTRHTPSPREGRKSVDRNTVSPTKRTNERSKSWSLPKDADPRKSWSKSPKDK